MSDQTEPFDYKGRLVFNGLSRADLTEPSEVFERLPEYNEGSPSEPGSGFVKLDMNYVEAHPNLGPKLDQSLGDRIALRYKEESYSKEEMVNSEGEVEEAFSKSIKTSDVFWIPPGYLIYRGPRGVVNKLREEFGELLDTDENISKIELDQDFLIWLFYMYDKNKEFPTDLRIDRLTDVKIINNNDPFGTTSRISGSAELARDSTLIKSILRDNKIETLGGYFIYNRSHILSADISTEGRIHVKTKADLQQATSFERMLLSLLFVREILDIYQTWKEMSSQNKYPPTEFFEELYRGINSRGVDSDLSIDPIIQKYNRKRGE